MAKKKIEYTAGENEAAGDLAMLLLEADALARKAGCRRFTWKFVTKIGNRFESDYDARNDPGSVHSHGK